METIIELMIAMAVINCLLSVVIFFFGFKKVRPEPEFKPVEFDWKSEGF